MILILHPKFNYIGLRIVRQCYNYIMFDKQKAKQLEQRSRNRGLLTKQLYYSEQVELERKRKQMKMELDRQVEEHRRQKEKEKMQQQLRTKREEEQINSYYKSLQNRQKKMSINSSNLQSSSMKYSSQPYQTYPNENQSDSKSKVSLLQVRNDNTSKFSSFNEPQIPLLPIMPLQQNLPAKIGNYQSNVLTKSKQNLQKLTVGSVPLIDFPHEHPVPPGNFKKVKNNKVSKRQKTVEAIREYPIDKKHRLSKILEVLKPSNIRYQDQTNTIVEQGFNHLALKDEGQEIKQEITSVQTQNQSLKQQLKKSQQALSLLIEAVKSSDRLNKYRVQAQKILAGKQESVGHKQKQENKKQQEHLMLPTITVKHQSILNDYLISAARKGKKPK